MENSFFILFVYQQKHTLYKLRLLIFVTRKPKELLFTNFNTYFVKATDGLSFFYTRVADSTKFVHKLRLFMIR